MSKVRAAIVGVGETAFRTNRPDKNYAELAQEAAMGALEMANMTPDDIDSVVFSMAPTGFMGITDVEKWAISEVFGRDKPYMRVHTGGATGGSATQAGYFHIASGAQEVVLVVGADKVSETPDAQFLLNLIWDPFYERSFALNTVTMAALQAMRHMDKFGSTQKQFAAFSAMSWRNASRNPYAHLKKADATIDDVLASPLISTPLRRMDCCPRSSGGAAIIIASERIVKERNLDAAWINGVGANTNTVYLGDRMGPRAQTEYGKWDELKNAAKEAYRQARITEPAKEIDLAELYAPFSCNGLMGIEALGFCKPGEAGPLVEEGAFELGGRVAVNQSGGSLCANPIGVTGLVRTCDAALQILGKSGDCQVKNVETAVATAVGGSFQFQTCTILGKEPR